MKLTKALRAPADAALPSVLSIYAEERDRRILENVLSQSFRMVQASTIPVGLKSLRKIRFAAVLCDTDAPDGTWQQVLQVTASLPDAPLLIVTSRIADETLWAEALNLGAWDVLAKPFDEQEVARIMSSACRQWQARCATTPVPSRMAGEALSIADAAELSSNEACA